MAGMGGWGARSRTRVWCGLLRPEVFLEGKPQRLRGVGWTRDAEGAEGMAPKGGRCLGFLVATEEAPGGFWGVRGADLGTPVQAWEQALKWEP